MYLQIIYIFSILGILDTVYLSYHAFTKTPVKCLFFPDEWCAKVQFSKFSKIFGIPNPFLGLLMYVAILILASLFAAGSVPFLWLQLIIGFGFLFSLYFTIIQAFVLKAWCTWCVVSAINFLALAIAAFILY